MKKGDITVTRLRQLSVPALLALLLAGCGGGAGQSGGTIPVNPPIHGVNRPPVITSLSPSGTPANPTRLEVDKTQRIVVAATDPDNDTLTYRWTADVGTVVPHSPDADFTAPASPCAAVVTVEVDDGHGHKASARCHFLVFKPDTPEPPNPPNNDPPVISNLVANPSSVKPGETSTVTVTASDPEGDPLTYAWTANGGGIQSESGNGAVWKAPSATGSYTVTVSVSDGHNPAVWKSVAIGVSTAPQTPITNGLAAVYIQNSSELAHPDLSKGQVVFTRVDPNVNFDWGQKAPDPRLVTNPVTGNGHDFGVIWRGYVKCEAPGVYAFRARYDDGFRLFISDDSNVMRQVMDGWSTGPVEALDGQITLKGGKWYKLEARFFEDEDRSYVQLYWLPPGAAQYTIVPTDALRTP